MAEPRSLLQKKVDTLYRLENDKDLWASSSGKTAAPYLVPLNFYWHGSYLIVTTILSNPTAQNMLESKKLRVALGHTRDVVLIDTKVNLTKDVKLIEEYDSAWLEKHAWSPAKSEYTFFELTPCRIEVWRELNEHAERILMRNGKWLV